ncbi:MAG TPA: dicarboxylate transporter/tellurite-resistance protein TehA [Stellaceae bacterium]|nr:dicarboxylate transporter/tellurite-resistance protein TehA [Stellaceae bacterium]
MDTRSNLPIVPASFFGIVLGMAGLGGAWRAAHRLWGVPEAVGETLLAVATAVWAVVLLFQILKWIFARQEAIAEAHHPVQCCFIGLIGVATLLIALAVLPYSREAAVILFFVGGAFTVAFAVWRTGLLWQGDRDHVATTAVLYLPTVAGGFVMATAAAALGWPDWGQLAFGGAFFSWLAIESVLLHRLYTAVALAPPLRPTIGIQLAPPTVGCVAYLSVNGGVPDLAAHVMIGYGLLQAMILLRLLPWILHQGFSPGFWGFTFGTAALTTATIRLVERGDTGPIAVLAPGLFIAANVVIGLIALATLHLIIRGRLLTPPAPKPAEAVTATPIGGRTA